MKFRRRSSEGPDLDASAQDGAVGATGEPDAPADEQVAQGPYDVEDLPAGGPDRVDLGSLRIAPEAGRELRLQVDEPTGAVQAVVLAAQDGALELRAFAAPRHGDLWSEVRPQIAADMAQRGGTATEREGVLGTELVCRMTVQQPDGTTATQPSVIIGVNGSRWLLRATLMGRPALEPELPAEWVATLRSVAVHRGQEAMPVGEPLPVVMPPQARKVVG